MTQQAARTRRRDAHENLDALLETATRVLADDPAAGVADIAEAAGLGRVTAWRHLGSREALLARVQDRAVAETRDRLAAVLGEDAPSTADVGRAVEELAAIGNRYRVLFIAQPSASLSRGRRKALAPLEQAIARGQRGGTLNAEVSADLAATLLAELAHGALRHTARNRRARPRAIAAARRFAETALTPSPNR